jgi:hypothetical protein
MRPEFPIDKWLRKHLTPLKLLLFIVIVFPITICAPHILPQTILIVYICLMLSLFFVASVGQLIWRIIWEYKYPYRPEFCKECKQILPEKFEE